MPFILRLMETKTITHPPSGERIVLSVPEVAELLGISRTLAYELVARGELPHIRLGRRVVITRVAIARLVGVEPGEVA